MAVIAINFINTTFTSNQILSNSGANLVVLCTKLYVALSYWLSTNVSLSGPLVERLLESKMLLLRELLRSHWLSNVEKFVPD